MRTKSLLSWRIIAPLLLCLTATDTNSAEDYYRWVSADGVVHYGSRPPEGVEAEKISTYGQAGVSGNSTASSNNESQASVDEQRKSIAEEQKKMCEDEKKRLSMLRSPGKRIRMEQPDGTSRYLSAEELSKEITTSQEFIDQACK